MPCGISRRDFLVLSSAFASAGIAASSFAESAGLPFRNAALPVSQRVEDLLARMTFDEKLAQLMCLADHKVEIEDGHGQFDLNKAKTAYPVGIGHIASPGLYADRPPEGRQRDPLVMAEYVNAVQKWAIEDTRLGIPILFHEEALHGHRAEGGTSFPQAIALASSWDTAMVEEVFSVAARETRARGAQMVLTPVVDVARDPRWGRVEETYGEDVYLVSEMGLAAVRGFQGKTLPLAPDKVFATLKHFVADSESVNGTNAGPALIPERTLREVFLRPFERIVKELPIRSIMVTYNEVDGLPCTVNPWLLQQILGHEWGFKGMTVSDYKAIKELNVLHQLESSLAGAAVRAINAGVDVEFPDPDTYPLLKEMVAQNKVAMKRIDEAVARVLTCKFEAGIFERPYVDPQTAVKLVGNESARALAVRAAERSIVLLKNKNEILPLKKGKYKRICVLGTHANDTPLGGYSGTPPYVVSILNGIRKEVGDAAEVSYSEGVRLTNGHNWYGDEIHWTLDAVNDKLIADGVEAARNADVVVLVLGQNEEMTREAWSLTHLGDRTSMDLLGRQNELAEKVLALRKPVVAILLNGSPLAVNLLAEKADALVEGWYLGQETGTGMAHVLFGRINPGGKLPISIPRSAGQMPIYYNYKPTARRGYVDGLTTPLYPFGFGLSYTRFEIGTPTLLEKTIQAGQTVHLEVEVANMGSMQGDEVVQVYIHHPYASVTTPVRELKAFRRVTLAAGERRTLSFELNSGSLALWNSQMRFVVETGTYEILVGPNSVDLKSITLTIV